MMQITYDIPMVADKANQPNWKVISKAQTFDNDCDLPTIYIAYSINADMLYIGKTMRSLKLRLRQHKYNHAVWLDHTFAVCVMYFNEDRVSNFMLECFEIELIVRCKPIFNRRVALDLRDNPKYYENLNVVGLGYVKPQF